MNLSVALFLVLLSVGGLSCGGQTNVDALRTADGGTDSASDGPGSEDGPSAEGSSAEDTGTDAPADAPDDTMPPTFCSGASKLSYGGAPPCDVQVTSTPRIMNCCDAAMDLVLHASCFTNKFRIGVISYLMPMPSGTFPIDTVGYDTVQVTVDDGRDSMPDPSVTGEVVWQWDGQDQTKAHVGLCMQVSAPGDVMDGTRVFVSNAAYAASTGISLHLLKDKTINAIDAQSEPLDSLELDSTPLLSWYDVEYYDWTNQWVVPNSWMGDVLAPYESLIGTRGLPFVLVANEERIYLGALWTPFSSQLFYGPYIEAGDATPSVLEIKTNSGGKDDRFDARILDALVESGKVIY